MYTIRFCHIDEYKKLMQFIKDHWRLDHVFAHNKDILDWQYLNQREDRYNFVVAFNHDTKEFDAILGFIPTAHFDEELKKNGELWLALWRVKDSATHTISGMNLLHFLRNQLRPVSIYAIGISDITKDIYRVLGYKVSKMKHFYIKNTNTEEFRIAKFPFIDNINEIISHDFCEIKEIDYLNYKTEISSLLENSNVKPKKSVLYFENRYLKHPWLNYQYLGIFKNKKLYGVIIFRVIKNFDAKCLRIMDWIGDFPDCSIYMGIQNILKNFDAEYIDFVCSIPDEDSLIAMGFKQKDKNYCMIPEYFNPFVSANIDIFYCAKTKENYRLVKGDSDQDRPNFL